MSKFKKTCFQCGAKIETLIDGRCENCYKEEFPPIKELKPINIKYCNSCQNINYNNNYISQEEFKERLPKIIEKNIILNDNYILKEINIKNFNIKGDKVSFDFEVDCDLK